jgi:hypothetical protein
MFLLATVLVTAVMASATTTTIASDLKKNTASASSFSNHQQLLRSSSTTTTATTSASGLQKTTTSLSSSTQHKGFMDSLPSAGALGEMALHAAMKPHSYWFHPPNTQVEALPDGELTMDGGNFESASNKDCALLAQNNNGVCPPPCATKWPNGMCILKDASQKTCLCVDPCTAFDLPSYDEFGHETALSGCEHCVRHKSRSHLRFEPWTIMKSEYTCGFCGTTCVSADKNGPSRSLMEECADQFDWTLQDCRRVELNSEDIAGSETQASFDAYSDTPDPELALLETKQ